jgi:hypothetical protein
MSRTFTNGYTNLRGQGQGFISTLESRFPRFKDVLKIRFMLTPKKQKIYYFQGIPLKEVRFAQEKNDYR